MEHPTSIKQNVLFEFLAIKQLKKSNKMQKKLFQKPLFYYNSYDNSNKAKIMKFKFFAFCVLFVWCFSVDFIFNGKTPRYVNIVESHTQEILHAHAQGMMLNPSA